MAKLTIEVTPDALADLLGDLAPEQLRQVLTALANRIEVTEWMVLSEPAFHDWLAEGDPLAPAASRKRAWVVLGTDDPLRGPCGVIGARFAGPAEAEPTLDLVVGLGSVAAAQTWSI